MYQFLRLKWLWLYSSRHIIWTQCNLFFPFFPTKYFYILPIFPHAKVCPIWNDRPCNITGQRCLVVYAVHILVRSLLFLELYIVRLGNVAVKIALVIYENMDYMHRRRFSFLLFCSDHCYQSLLSNAFSHLSSFYFSCLSAVAWKTKESRSSKNTYGSSKTVLCCYSALFKVFARCKV